MYNEHLSIEDAKERMKERMQDAENYRLYNRLGYSDSGNGKWVFISIVLVIITAVVLL